MEPALAAASPPLRQRARSEKREARRKKEEEETGYQKAYRGGRVPANAIIVTGREKRDYIVRTCR